TINVQTVAVLVKIGDVPRRVASQLHYGGDPGNLADDIQASADPSSSVLRVTASSASPQEAVTLANAFAHQTIAYLTDQQAISTSTQARDLKKQLDDLQGRTQQLDGQIAKASPTAAQILRAQRDAIVNQYQLLYTAYQQLASTVATTLSLQVID